MEDWKDRDEEIIGFISTLIGSIPTRKLNDERLHIICGNGLCGLYEVETAYMFWEAFQNSIEKK